MRDPFVGLWKLNPAKSQFDPNHRPTEATMLWELDADGAYVMKAEGRTAEGGRVAERPQRFIPDGQPYPVADFPGLVAVTSRPEANTVRAIVKRADGTIAGEGTYVVSTDDNLLTATTVGFDSQLRRFESRTSWQGKMRIAVIRSIRAPPHSADALPCGLSPCAAERQC